MKWVMLSLIILSSLVFPSWSHAATRTAATCGKTDVLTEVNAAVSDVDTVQIPGGTCTWAGATFDVGVKSIVIQGVGAGTLEQCAVAAQTTYTCIIMDAATVRTVFRWTVIPTGTPRITALTFDSGTGAGNPDGDGSGMVQINGKNGSFRMDHVNLYQRRGAGGATAFHTNGYVRGVLDHNIFHCGLGAGSTPCIVINHGFWGGGSTTCTGVVQGCGDPSWAAATGFGGSNWLFVEDNRVINKPSYAYCSDGWVGQRYVWRYNIQTDCSTQNHGSDSSGRTRGGRAMEVYGNVCTMASSSISATCHASRGGTLLSWGNIGTGSILTSVQDLAHQRILALSPSQCAFWSCSDNSAANTFDQGTGTSNGYAAMDQIGRGIGDLLTGPATNKTAISVNGTLDCHTPDPDACWPNQALEPVYIWNSRTNSTGVGVGIPSGGTDYVNENRDYYRERAAGFDGTTAAGKSGVGVGTKAAMTASPCVTGDPALIGPDSPRTGGGQAWWVTDEGTWATGTDSTGGNHAGFDGQLYKCTTTGVSPSAGVWTLFYTPYTYPHPLVTETPVEPPVPQPTGLRLISTSNTNHICLVWQPSTMENLYGYHVYHGLTAGVYAEVFVVHATNSRAAHKPVTQYCYTSVVAGVHYFSLSAYNNLGEDTDLATEVSATFTALSRTAATQRSPTP